MSKIKKPQELPTKKNVIGGIYGQPGIGKTTLALSFPKPLLLDTDNGMYRVQAEHRTDSVPVESYQDILDVLQEDLSSYDTIVIDTLGKLIDFMCTKICEDNPNLVQKDGTMAIKAWGLVKNNFKKLITDLTAMGKNIIFVAHEREDKEDDHRILRPDVSGSAGKDIIKELDFLGYVEMVGKKRSISFAPSSKFYAKNSLKLNDYLPITLLNDGIDNNFMTEYILKPTIAKRQTEFTKNKQYEKVISEAKKIIANGCDLEKLRALPKVGDSQLRIKAMIDEAKKNG